MTLSDIASEATFVNYIDEDTNNAIKDMVDILEDGPLQNTQNYRNNHEELKKHYDNVFDKNISMDSNPSRTEIIRSALARTEVDVTRRGIKFPGFDIEAVNRSRLSIDAKNKQNITRAYIEFMIRITGLEGVFRESTEEWIWAGDTFRRPTLRPKRNQEGVFLPGYEDLSGVDLFLDPNSRNVHSESYAKQAQFYAHSQTYTESDLVARFGEWIIEHAQPGFFLDEQRSPAQRRDVTGRQNDGTGISAAEQTNINYYEVLEYQNKADLTEFVLVGANAFPVVWIAETDRYEDVKQTKELKKLEAEGKVVWGREYNYFDTLGEPILMLFQNFCYLNTEWPYNRGIVERVFDHQIADELLQNLKFDNVRQLMDYVFFISGGRPEAIKSAITEYRQDRRKNRDAFLHVSPGATGNIPEFGVLKPQGVPVNEADAAIQSNLNMVKNSTGINPQRQEVQKNTGVGQSEILQEEKTDAIESIVEDNLVEFQRELKGLVYFGLAHDGFGLDDVMINFTKFSEKELDLDGNPVPGVEENPNATISITNALKELDNFDFDVIIDRSNIVKKSRFVENQKITQALGAFPIQPGMQKLLSKAWKQVFQNLGIDVQDEDFGSFEEGQASGGASQQQNVPGGAGGELGPEIAAEQQLTEQNAQPL